MKFAWLRLAVRAPLLSRFAMIAVPLIAVLFAVTAASTAQSESAIDVKVVASQELANVPGSKLTAVIVNLPPGARAPKHHHAGFVFAYVVSGTVRSQLNGGTIVDYRAGQNWVEPPGTGHTMTANPGRKPAKLLAVFVAPDGATLTTYNK